MGLGLPYLSLHMSPARGPALRQPCPALREKSVQQGRWMCQQMTSLGCDLGSGRGPQGVERGKRQRGILSWMERLVGVSHMGRGGAFWEEGTAPAETRGFVAGEQHRPSRARPVEGFDRDGSLSSPFRAQCLHHCLWAALPDPPNQPHLSPVLSWVSHITSRHPVFIATL